MRAAAVFAGDKVVNGATYGNYISGRWTTAEGTRLLAVRNPAHRQQIVAQVAIASEEDAHAAIDAAAAALPSWSATPAPRRGEYLRAAAAALRRRRDEAATLLTREEGKPLFESRAEVDRSIALLEFYAGQGMLLTGQTFPSALPGRLLYTVPCPLGVAALITPWNFPSAIPVWKTAPALLCGNTVVLKPASLAPVSAAIFAECLHEAGLPAGVFNMVVGPGSTVGNALVGDERVKVISFTGSLAVGRALLARCAPRLVRVGLEMGGKNPHIVADDADIDRAVADVIAGAFWSAGHKCTACSRAIVMAGVYERFLGALVERVRQLRIGDGLEPSTQIGPVISEDQARSILEYIDSGVREGAQLLVGGQRLAGGIYDEGCYISPAVFANVAPTMRIAREEIFGPVLCVMKAESFDHAIALANDAQYGLSASISTRSLALSMEFARRIAAGVVHINSPTAGLEPNVPFGGWKDSTSGYREMGLEALRFYTQLKTVYVDA